MQDEIGSAALPQATLLDIFCHWDTVFEMSSSSINVSLPKAMRAYVEAESVKAGHSTVSEYVRLLIRQDQERKLVDLRREVAVGLRQADAGDLSSLDVQSIQAKGRRILARRRKDG